MTQATIEALEREPERRSGTAEAVAGPGHAQAVANGGAGTRYYVLSYDILVRQRLRQ